LVQRRAVLYITFITVAGLGKQKICCFEDCSEKDRSSVWKQGKGLETENSFWEGAEEIGWASGLSFGFGGQQNEEILIVCKILHQLVEKSN
jgi:hypothetical protein